MQRAVRGHFLVHLALSEIIFSCMDLTDTEKGLLDALMLDVRTDDFELQLKEEHFLAIKKNCRASEITKRARSYLSNVDSILGNDLTS